MLLTNLSVKKESMKEVSDRQLSSNEMEKVLEMQSSSLFRRRVPSFAYPDFRFGHGLGMYTDDLDPGQLDNGAVEQQKMLQNLLQHYQKTLMDDPQWLGAAAAAAAQVPEPKYKKKEPEVDEPREEPKSCKRGRRDEEGKSFSKQRKTNFTANEVEALLNCVRNMKDVILFGVAGGRGWAKAWQDIAKVVTKVEGIQRSEGDVRKKWTYLKWEAKNTSKPGRDPVSKQVLNILTSRDREVQEAMTMRDAPQSKDKPGSEGSEKGRRPRQSVGMKLREVYEQVAARMLKDKGYLKTGGQCKVKWKHMRASFMESVRKRDRTICPIYFDQLFHMLEWRLEERTRSVARTMLVKERPGPPCPPKPVAVPPGGTKVLILNEIAGPGKKSRGKTLAVKVQEVEDLVVAQPSGASSSGEGKPPMKMLKFILPKGSVVPTAARSLLGVKIEHPEEVADIDIKEEPLEPPGSPGPLELEPLFGAFPTHYEERDVPPAHTAVPQPLPQVANAGQVTPQPSPPPVVAKKQNLPPLAPKPTSAKPAPASGTAGAKQPPKLLPKPSSPPEVCLRWNSYHSNMQNTFPSLLNNEQFVDVTLACDGRSIKCHKVMLSACSPYMEELLSSNPCQHPIILLKDMKFWQLQALVDFMYRGEVNVTQDKLPSLLSAAEALQIKGLASPVNHGGPPKITQVQTLATPAHDLTSDDMDQVTYMRHLQLQSDVKAEYDDEYMQDTDESQPPTPKAKKRKISHATSTSNGTVSKQTQSNARKKERQSEPSTSHNPTSTHNEHKRRSDPEKRTSVDANSKSYADDNRSQGIKEEDLDIDEEQAQIILERYSSQNDDYSRPDDMDDNSTTSG